MKRWGFAVVVWLVPSAARADGCYVCDGTSTYVRFKGDDTWAKRHQAEACGCKVVSTVSSCDAAHAKILCSVASRSARSPDRAIHQVGARSDGR
jgi:hypothetical protein